MTRVETGFSWPQILRLALVQTAIGAMVVLTTSTMNRVMVVEHGLAATVPGVLVALHYAVQMLRPRFGHGADAGRNRSRWIIGGLAVLALGTVSAAAATGWMRVDPVAGFVAASLAFTLIGVGVGAAGTNLLALVAAGVAPHRRPAAATAMWTLMIAGFALTAGIAGSFLDPFSDLRLVAVTGVAAGLAFLLGTLAVAGLETSSAGETGNAAADRARPADFRASLAAVWREPATRSFTYFVFVSMFAYSAQDLVLEPFAGTLFAMTPGETTQLTGAQHGGTFSGMIAVALAGWAFGKRWPGLLRLLSTAGCLGSALAFAALVSSAVSPGAFPLTATVATLGFFNGLFAVAAIGSMMGLSAGTDEASPRHGIRMGLWGAAQAIAFALGGFSGTLLVDIVAVSGGTPAASYGTVFMIEGLGFLLAARLGWRCLAGPSTAGTVPADAEASSIQDRGEASAARRQLKLAGQPA